MLYGGQASSAPWAYTKPQPSPVAPAGERLDQPEVAQAARFQRGRGMRRSQLVMSGLWRGALRFPGAPLARSR
ncbi:hypothetical protein AAFF_G00230130 [Aldrovandia affinis]|uniref:Uncharacterized protein n=1 Tax=Aldrovandia affinis TaxID=143900 RepID=A0AAD7SWW4_9TELE|nr:hypothetical protein AAFF_G00230130 [Aldrovandia affinis]